MDRLPPEILSLIVSHLPIWIRNPAQSRAELVRPGIASVSRKWQFAVERLVFRDVQFKNTELGLFASIFSDPRRRALIETLRFEIVLPTYSDAECGLYESDQDRLANNSAASEAVAGIFRLLSSWGSDPAIAIRLLLVVHSPMDPSYRGAEKLARNKRDLWWGSRPDLFAKRYENSYIQLSDLDKLPVVACLKWVSPHAGNRKFHPGSYLALITKAPARERMTWTYYEPDIFLALRRQMRDELVQNLKAIRLSPSTRELTVDFNTLDWAHGERSPNLVFPQQHDPLCAALHQLFGNKLEKLAYAGQVDPSFFWPYPEDGPREPFWSSLSELTVTFDMRSPSGRWYFRAPPGDPHNVPASDEPLPDDTVGYMPPGYGSERETADALAYLSSLRQQKIAADGTGEFRIVPEEEMIVPLLEAFARAAAQMPALESACLTTRLRAPYFSWSVAYVAPKTVAADYAEYLDSNDRAGGVRPRVFLDVHEWEIPEPALGLLRRIANARHGQDAILTHMTSLDFE